MDCRRRARLGCRGPRQTEPAFFGSALTNFGVEPFLKEFCVWPRRRAPYRYAHQRTGRSRRDDFSGFVFKIQANMDQEPP